MSTLLPEGMLDRLARSPEPAARWIALNLLGAPSGQARSDVLEDPLTQDLIARLVPWESEHPVGGHNAPTYAPNLLNLLFDQGLRPGDDPRVDDCLRAMLEHQHADGRFLALGRTKAGEAVWAALPCDTHAVLEVLLRAGYGHDPRVRAGIGQLCGWLTRTAQGPGWTCVPDPQVGFRGPGRKGDICPQVSLQALRVLSMLPGDARPAESAECVRTALRVWARRGEQRPYMFGHGRSFKEGKYPATWYSALTSVETLGRFPQVWSGPDAAEPDVAAMAELGAVLRAYSLDADGVAVPRSVFNGFQAHSFGRRGQPSDFVAASLARALLRLEPITERIDKVDVSALGSAKGGTGRPRPPRTSPATHRQAGKRGAAR